MASYPGSIPVLTNPTSTNPLNSPSHSTQHINENDEIEAICTELGTNPKGIYPTVRDRLEGIEASIDGHTQNTDQGTTNATFYINGITGPYLKGVAGNLQLRNHADDAYVSLTLLDINVQGNITDGVDSVTVNELQDAVDDMHSHVNKALLDTYTQSEANLASAVSLKHTQNTDTGTTNETFQMNNVNPLNSAKIKVDDLTPTYVDIRNAADNAYGPLRALRFEGPLAPLGTYLNYPMIRYSTGDSWWELSNDGVSFQPIGTGLSLGGVAGNVQYHGGANLAGEAAFTYNAATDTLSVVNINLSGNLTDGANTVTVAELDDAVDASHAIATVLDSASVDFTLAGQQITAVVLPAGVDHNSLNNYDANRHIDHTAVSISAGTGLTGGGNISANRTLSLSHLGLELLTDPGADNLIMWDDTDGLLQWITVGTNLTYTHATHTLSAAGGGGTLDQAYDYGGAGAGRTITADSGAVQIDSSNLATYGLYVYANVAHSANLVRIHSDDATSTGTALNIIQDGTGHGLGITLTTAPAASMHGLLVYNAGAARVNADSAVCRLWDSQASTEPVLEITNDGTGAGIEITQNGTGMVLYASNLGTNHGLVLDQGGVLTGGKHSLYIYSNVANVNADSALAKLHQDSASATEPALEIVNDGTGAAIEIAQNGNGQAITMTNTGTNTCFTLIQGGVLSNDKYGMNIYTNAVQTNNDAFVSIWSDNASSTQNVLVVTNDGTGHGLLVETLGTGNGCYLYTGSAIAAGKHLLLVQANTSNADAALVKLVMDNVGSTEPALEIYKHGYSSAAIEINCQSGGARGIEIYQASAVDSIALYQASLSPALTIAGSAGGSIRWLEIAAAPSDTAAYGQVWVKNDSPNTLYFTDDAGNDYAIGGASVGAGGIPTNIQVFTSSGTWTKPAGVSQVYVKVWGGGGSGGSSSTSNTSKGGGGGGGYSEGLISVTGNVTVTIGAGGASVTANNNGNAGGTSSFAGSTTIQATGGSGGTGGGTVGGVGSVGTINLTGQTGGDPLASSLTSFSHGAGGNSPFGGNGGATCPGATAGKPGFSPGGGGSGGWNGSGAGYAGMVIVMY